MTITNRHFLYGLSSLSRYFGRDLPGFSFELIEGSIVDVAKAVDNTRYPGVDEIDAICTLDETEHVFRCVDSLQGIEKHPLSVMNLLYDRNRECYMDRAECYRDIRTLNLRLLPGSAGLSLQHLLEASALVSCFGFKPDPETVQSFNQLKNDLQSARIPRTDYPSPLIQRLYLSAVLSGEFPAAGLKMLRDFGAVEQLWPELDALCGLDQAKEFHPEGDVWEHSLETLYHRKTNDLDLSFALLLHDVGKPLSLNVNGNRFNNHAQIGGDAAAVFLRRLEYPEDRIDKIRFLVGNHMMPAAINSLPTFRTEAAMRSLWFPMLLEVYRCDLLSSFNGPEGYYDACKTYRSFIKNVKNPFRTPAGKKLYRQYVD